MSIRKIYQVIGVMSGTSMDGLDCSYIKTDGMQCVSIISEKTYDYSKTYRNNLRKIINLYKKNKKRKILKYDNYITNKILRILKKFIKEHKIKKEEIDFIGLSGQTIYHSPKEKLSIQLGSPKIMNKKLNIKIVGNFRNNDIKNNGQGAPIGAFYHKYIINKYSRGSAILNIGGISNITFLKNNKIYAFDVGPGNCLIDDLMNYHYKKNFDKNGKIAKNGKTDKKILNSFKKDVYFNINYPKSLDRNYYTNYFKNLKKINKKNSLNTATMMTIKAIDIALNQININFNALIITGGGRKNTFLIENIKKLLNKKNIKTKLIDDFNFNGDMLESQAFGYLAIRSYLRLPISLPTTTGVKKPLTGGDVY